MWECGGVYMTHVCIQKIEERETRTVESNKSDKKFKMQEKELKRIMQS